MERPIDLLRPVIEQLREAGLNHWGIVSREVYDSVASPGLTSADLAPWAKSILVLASGGRALWDDMCEAILEDKRRLTRTPHPVDCHVGEIVQGVPLSMVRHRWFMATATAEVQLDFRSLAVLGGIGSPSRLGLVIDRQFGPWMGLRAACFLEWELPPSRPAPDVCEGCSAPCVSACPAGALPDGQWDVGVCAAYHRTSKDCDQTCHARVACPVGEAHRYSDLEQIYHYDRARGRVLLREALGVDAADDPHQGIGPHWEAWD